MSRVCLVTSEHYIGFLLSYSHCCILPTLSIRNRSARYNANSTKVYINDQRTINIRNKNI